MTLLRLPALLVGLVVLGGCCFPMQSFHKPPTRYPSEWPAAGQPRGDDANAPQEYIMQDQPPRGTGAAD